MSAFGRSALYGALLSCALAACSSQPGGGAAPLHVADTITRAVYADDLDTTIDSFDDNTKRAVTRSELGELSDRMHALGTLQSITQRSGNLDTGRYEFDATFSGGTMLVQMRIDPSGKVGAYRVIPEATGAPPSPSTQG